MTIGSATRIKLKISADYLLLVEGRDEVNLIGGLIRFRLGEELGKRIQIIDAGGKDKFIKNLQAIKTASLTRPTLRSIGVVRDADDDATSAFSSVAQSVANVGYDPPSAHGEFSDARPSIGIFIVPDGTGTGAIETLCRRSRSGGAISECVDKYLRCLVEHEVMHSRNEDKSFTHAYLAAMTEPVARVGEGALQGVWDFDSEAFLELSGFLQNLVHSPT